MGWTEGVDHYCERVAPGLWGEPLNTLTGLAFLAAGLWFLRGPAAADRRLAAAALALVGLASALQHAVAQVWTVPLNLAANHLFLAALYALGFSRLAALSLPRAILAGIAAALVADRAGAALAATLPPASSAVAAYLPILALLLLAAAGAGRRRGLLVLSALALAGGLPFRLADAAWCATWPQGTHWLWHLFNAASICLAMAALSGLPRRAGPSDVPGER